MWRGKMHQRRQSCRRWHWAREAWQLQPNGWGAVPSGAVLPLSGTLLRVRPMDSVDTPAAAFLHSNSQALR